MKISMLFKSLLVFIALISAQISLALVEDEDTIVTQLKALKAQCASAPDKVGCYELGINVLIGETNDQHLIDLHEALKSPGITLHGTINGFQFLINAETQEEFRGICLDENVKSMPNKVTSADITLNGKTVFRQFPEENEFTKAKVCLTLESIALNAGLVDSNLPSTAKFDISIVRGKDTRRVPEIIEAASFEALHDECVAYFRARRIQENKADMITFSVNGGRMIKKYNKDSYWQGADRNCGIIVSEAQKVFSFEDLQLIRN